MCDEALRIPSHLLSRLLYPNPVCLLSVKSAGAANRNAMVISWLTAIDNNGTFFCSLNLRRHTAKFVDKPGSIFVLNPAVQGMEPLLLKVGGCSGRDIDKFDEFGIACCCPGWQQDVGSMRPRAKQKLSAKEQKELVVQEARNSAIAVAEGVAAHLLCKVLTTSALNGHQLTVCQIIAAWARPSYWSSGKTFVAAPPSPSLLGFLGTKTFVCMQEVSSVTAGDREERAAELQQVALPQPQTEQEGTGEQDREREGAAGD